MAFYSGKIIKEPARKKSPFLMIMLTLFVLLGVGGYLAYSHPLVQSRLTLYRCYWNPTVISRMGTKQGIAMITITPGEDPLTIGKDLEKKGVIHSATDFFCYIRKIEAGNKIQAGYYEIQLPVTLEQVVPLLQNSRIPTVRITIPEGLRMDEIAERIDTGMSKDNEVKKFSKTEFLGLTEDKEYIASLPHTQGAKSLEGFLFPDTYEFAKNATAKEIIDILTSTFSRKTTTTAPLDGSKTFTPYQVLVMASIIEKEAGKSFEEKQMVAGILEKRYKNNWLLQVDATFLYDKKDWKAPITLQDKASNSAFNTYKHLGLPPTPICNPGLESIRAVLEPKESAYWFYLHGLDGNIRYGRTIEEHNRNISLYLRP